MGKALSSLMLFQTLAHLGPQEHFESVYRGNCGMKPPNVRLMVILGGEIWK